MTMMQQRDIRAEFVGRKQALDIFYQRFVYRHTQNVVYYYGHGGVGKSWILQKIHNDIRDDPQRAVSPVIDFFDTRHQTVLGLQSTLRQFLDLGREQTAFAAYHQALQHLFEARAAATEKYPGLIASLESRVNTVFIEDCMRAISGREIILLFDTLERVQRLYCGKWLLSEFLPRVRGPIIVLCGRPEPTPARMPNNALSYRLQGLEPADVLEYMVRRFGDRLPAPLVERIWRQTDGTPLLIDLIADLVSKELIDDLAGVDQLADTSLKEDLARHFWQLNDVNLIIWAMSFLRRRFDTDILQHIVRYGNLVRLQREQYEAMLQELRGFRFVKSFTDDHAHLLHDEMQQIIATYVLDQVDPEFEIREGLYQLIVQTYYSDLIARRPEQAKQLEAERFGYELDRAVANRHRRDRPDLLAQAYRRYEALCAGVDQSHDYDVEELLWSELRARLRFFPNDGFDIAVSRGRWLRKHSLNARAEEHYTDILELYPAHERSIRQGLGYASLRLGKIDKAIESFSLGRALVAPDSPGDIAAYENLLGQANRIAGYWDVALRHYAKAMRAFTLAESPVGMAGVCTNRGGLYALQGSYEEAIRECTRALALLGDLPETDPQAAISQMYALMNIGTAYRHSADFARSEGYYTQCLKLARERDNYELICSALQQLGINTSLTGRRLREQYDPPTGEILERDCEYQHRAWDYLAEAHGIAQGAGWRAALASTLHRMARIYEEIHYLTGLPPDHPAQSASFAARLRELQQQANQLQLVVDGEFPRNLVARRPFAELSWLEKTARLFELSALLADEVNDFHRTIEALMSLARRLLDLGRNEAFPIIIRRAERIKGYHYQDKLFTAQIEINKAHHEFALERYDAALRRYAQSFVDLAHEIGYAAYQIADRLRGLESRIERLPVREQLAWCDYLEEYWLDAGMATDRPELLHFLENLRLAALGQGNRSATKRRESY